ncbi:fatty acid desaturase family protein [[Mycobacterium] burgundiense]|uniref:Fatty acid desaturase n=1 Tax=[Mycobacterium] burgundiense TaxID=3064286 RepID=A0ABM9LLR5_9MYCO|nr:fatty acid desaturase [Mycolicibacterium sp. MU0053]CAJ1501068.1 fatty acid desaturase [Mycolicibacterium sp. MU0053]
MAITDVSLYAHLSRTDIESLGAELDSIRQDVEDSLGARDAAYINRAIRFQRVLDTASRLLLVFGRSKTTWALGTAGLAAAKTVENMELGHNISHGQWDWMNDPEIHSNTWEWDMFGLSSQWRYSHNYRHHVYTNVHGVDDDLGFGIMRVSRDEPWKRKWLLQPVRNVLLALVFEWGIAMHGLHAVHDRAATDTERSAQTKAMLRKARRQLVKDYLLMPALSGKRWRRTLTGNAAANVLRNLWTYAVIFCGHFPDGAEKFTEAALADETKADWYLRQMLGTANFNAGPVLAFASGNLCYQIEHHLFPDLPSNRYAQIAERVRALCDKYDLPYTTGSFARQFILTQRTILKLALPDRYLRATADDAPETASERRFFPTVSGGDRTAVAKGAPMLPAGIHRPTARR